MTINELFDKVYSTDETKNPDTFIRLFEENIILIENQDLQIDNVTYNAVMRLTADYAHNLKMKESHTKALPYLDKAINLFENYSGFDKTKMNDVEFYRILRFDRGVSNYYKKNYSKSQLDFSWLIENNPENDAYKSWIFGLRYRKYDWVLNILWYIIAGSVILLSLIDRDSYRFAHDLIVYLGAFALVVAPILGIIKYLNKRKLNAA